MTNLYQNKPMSAAERNALREIEKIHITQNIVMSLLGLTALGFVLYSAAKK